MTDEHRGYRGIGNAYRHRTVNHASGQYVRWYHMHTNGIEVTWSHFKRQVISVHHWISEEHIERYISELTWHWNRRETDEGPRVNDLLNNTAARPTYRELIA